MKSDKKSKCLSRIQKKLLIKLNVIAKIDEKPFRRLFVGHPVVVLFDKFSYFTVLKVISLI